MPDVDIFLVCDIWTQLELAQESLDEKPVLAFEHETECEVFDRVSTHTHLPDLTSWTTSENVSIVLEPSGL